MNLECCPNCGEVEDLVPGDNHVKVTVEVVPPEDRPKSYYFHSSCFRRSQDWERGL